MRIQTPLRFLLAFLSLMGLSQASVQSFLTPDVVQEETLLARIVPQVMHQSPREWMNALLVLMALLVSTVVMKLILNAQLSAANRHYTADTIPHAGHRFLIGLTLVVKGLMPLMLYVGCYYGLGYLISSPVLRVVMEALTYGLGWYMLGDVLLSSFLSPRLAAYTRLATLGDKGCGILLGVMRSLLVWGAAVYVIQTVMRKLKVDHEVAQDFLKFLVFIGFAYMALLVLIFRKTVTAWLGAYGDGAVEQQKKYHFFAYLSHIWHVITWGMLVVGYSLWLHQGSGELYVLTLGTLWTIGIVFGLKVIFMLIQKTQNLLIQYQKDEGTPYKERLVLERLNVHIPYLFLAFKAIVVALAFMLVLEGWSINVFAFLDVRWILFMVRAAFENLLVIFVFVVIWEIFNVVMNYHMRPRMLNGQAIVISARARTLMPIIRMIGRVVIVVVGCLMVLSTFGVNIAPLLAGLSVFGLAISFGSQTLVKDFVTGLFILLENDIEVGDTVSIGGSVGVIEATTVRNIKLRDSDGALHIIPYSSIEGLINLSRDYTASTLEFMVGHQESLDKVIDLIRQVGDELQQDPQYQSKIMAPVMVLGVKSISDMGLTLLAKIRTQPDPHHAIVLEFYKRMKQKYDEHKIQIPVPQRQIFVRNV